MTLLLASIAGPAEAESAIAHGADIVDLRDATPQSLGAVVAAVRGRRPVSTSIGLQPGPEAVKALASATQALADAGADIVRIELFPDARPAERIRDMSTLADPAKIFPARIFGVLFADLGVDPALIPLMAESGFAGVMIDTTRSEKPLLDHLDVAALAKLTDEIRARGMMAGFAGALEAPDVPRLLLLAPDILGFDKGLHAVRPLIPADTRRLAPATQRVDYRLLSERGPPIEARRDVDRIFVHDFVLPVHIGTYARERDTPQNVRFSVDVRMARPGQAPEDMRDVFSYDVITDSIRMIVAQGHIPLVETLAERIAAAVLAHPRATNVTVRVEKLDTGSGTVGVEIGRERAVEAKVHPLFKAGASESDLTG